MYKRRIFFPVFFLIFYVHGAMGQSPEKPNSAEIFQALQRLNTLGSVLYVAAHPDDENTRLISWLSNEKNLDVTYLSLTRGDGGQNLIGPEIRELLGVIRTQELLMARSVDGGKQFFTRANDFGYSKNPAEALRTWGKDSILSDVVWAIRKLRPDIIINRFSADTASETHGHHTASAILSSEAFELAGDPSVFPGQLPYAEPWKPRRLFMNTSWYFYESREAFERAMKADQDLYSLDVGVYYPLLGKSNTEIAAISRSMHRCQGFGSAGSRGSSMEYLKLLKGDKAGNDIFEGIDMSWSRVDGGAEIGRLVKKITDAYELSDPAASIPGLLEVHTKIKALPEGFWKEKKLAETRQLIRWCMGLYLEAVAVQPSASPGEQVNVKIEAINRSAIPAGLDSVVFSTGEKWSGNLSLENNKVHFLDQRILLPEGLEYTSPYWLREPWETGRYTVEEQILRGLPESPPPVQAAFYFTVNGVPVHCDIPLVFRETDPARGEVYSHFEVVPPVFVRLPESVYLFPSEEPREIEVSVKAGKAGIKGQLGIGAAEGWSISPASYEVSLDAPGQEKKFRFTITPPAIPGETTLQAMVTLNGTTYHKEKISISYDHIPSQTVLKDSYARLVRVNLEKKGERIAYIMGAGDEIPESLEQIGYDVDVLPPAGITLQRLQQYDALITGVRAYNTVEELRFLQPVLFEYVRGGGTMIVQYNTTGRLVTDRIAPYPLELSRERVAEEDSEVSLLAPDHPLLNYPNKITEKDFEGWVQERGLYFPHSWDDAYTPLLSAADTGESAKKGGLLAASYGEGYFIYTGYSWFRELPAGVPGAYRLFSNMISIGK
ncbi:GlcNAc-PI de-N-acetylase [Anseongella ginsenosidimutans]|uniref:GlcNAc-PI de-N-acetylase n=1 Tax=Anseongella ginsenosidimutans TaxID=496056 RepID=A0A4R3KP54_9SPHI|nr:PIG-L family deacetylase [Anseongella ginsenosidimutans]QEC53989.1 PIG-L family deacetylase [Anseongella ginsenosidimutans]TCS86376.1 GlcNAc-PI de-N-acetylase [Anseongella ginsenosidimutans]